MVSNPAKHLANVKVDQYVHLSNKTLTPTLIWTSNQHQLDSLAYMGEIVRVRYGLKSTGKGITYL